MKELIRLKHLQLRNSLSQEQIAEKSAVIQGKLFELPEFKNSKAILFYASFKTEVETLKMIKKALEIDKIVCVPVTSFREKKIEISQIQSPKELEKKPNGLIEPKEIHKFPLEKINLIIF